MDADLVATWLGLAAEIVRCVGVEAGRELARMFEYQIALLYEDRALRLLAEHAVECAAAYVEHQRAAWDRNSLVRGAVFGAVFGHTETVEKQDRPGSAAGSRRVSVIVGQRELKWDVGDVLKRPGLRRDCLQYGLGAAPTSTSRLGSTAGDVTSAGLRCDCLQYGLGTAPTSTSRPGSTAGDVVQASCPWTFHVSAASDAALYGYRGALLDWDYFASAYAAVPDDDGWFNEQHAPHQPDDDHDFHRLYRPYRCLVGTELMQASDATIGRNSRTS